MTAEDGSQRTTENARAVADLLNAAANMQPGDSLMVCLEASGLLQEFLSDRLGDFSEAGNTSFGNFDLSAKLSGEFGEYALVYNFDSSYVIIEIVTDQNVPIDVLRDKLRQGIDPGVVVRHVFLTTECGTWLLQSG